MIFQKEYLHIPSERYPSSHASAIAELPDGTIISSWFAGSREKALDVALVYRRKEKNAAEWGPLLVLHKTPGKSDGNCCYYVEEDGTVYAFFNTIFWKGWTFNKIRYKISKDSGKTWSEPIWFRKLWGWVIRNKTIKLKNGKILLPVFSEVNGYKSFVCISDDNCKTFKKYGRIGSLKKGLLEPSVVQLSDDSLLMYCRTSGLGKIYMSRSMDNGRSWIKPEPTQFKNPDSAIDLLKLTSGELLVVYNDSVNERTPLLISLSEDDGKAWKYTKIIDKIPDGFVADEKTGYKGELSYPYMIQAKDGTIHITYTEHRSRIVHCWFDKEWIKTK